MRVLLTHRPPAAYGFISEGWLNAFQSVGHRVLRWDGSPEMWQQFRPDLYLGCSGHKQPIPTRHHGCRVAIHVNPFGDTDVGGINESVENRKWVLAQHPDAVFGYGLAADAHFWSQWTSIPWVPMATAADVTLFNRPPAAKQFDLIYVGGRWQYKAKRIDKWLLPLLLQGNLNYHLFGWGEWPGVRHSGPAQDRDVPELLAAARVGPCISEPHTGQYGFDVPERVFKVMASGTVAIHDLVPGLIDALPSLLVAEDPEHFQSLCTHYARAGQSVINELAARQRQDVLTAHTYHHRLGGLLAALGFDSAAAEMQTYIRGLN